MALWTMSRWICRGYSGIQKHNLELEKNLPYFEGISAEEILEYFTRENIRDIQVRNLDALPEILSRNLPWFVRFGYHSCWIIAGNMGYKTECL